MTIQKDPEILTDPEILGDPPKIPPIVSDANTEAALNSTGGPTAASINYLYITTTQTLLSASLTVSPQGRVVAFAHIANVSTDGVRVELIIDGTMVDSATTYTGWGYQDLSGEKSISGGGTIAIEVKAVILGTYAYIYTDTDWGANISLAARSVKTG